MVTWFGHSAIQQTERPSDHHTSQVTQEKIPVVYTHKLTLENFQNLTSNKVGIHQGSNLHSVPGSHHKSQLIIMSNSCHVNLTCAQANSHSCYGNICWKQNKWLAGIKCSSLAGTKPMTDLTGTGFAPRN